MKTRALLFFAFLILIPAVSSAQVGNFLKNQAARAANAAARESEKEANRRADSAIQANAERAAKETADKIERDSKANKTEDKGNQSQGGRGMFMGGKVDLKYNEDYSFTSRLYMQTETYDKKEVMKMDLFMFFSAKSPTVGIETKSLTDEKGNNTPVASTMVMDGENKCFIILTDMNGTKMGIISAIPDEKTDQTTPDGKPVQKVAPAEFTKTGNTKVIAGYKCDEYSYKNTENKTTGKVWFTKEANLKIDKRGWQNTGMAAYYGYTGFNDGVILANESYDEKGKLTMKSETKEINPTFSHSISVKGYSLMQMNLNQSQPKK